MCVGGVGSKEKAQKIQCPRQPPGSLTLVAAQVAPWAKQLRVCPDFFQDGLGQINAVLLICPPSLSLYSLRSNYRGREGPGRGWGMRRAGGQALCLALWGLPSLPRSQSVPAARDMAPPFGTVPIRSTPRLEVWLCSLSLQLRILSLPLSWSVCSTLPQEPCLGEIWGRPLSRPQVGGMCKLNGWPSWSWAWGQRERTGTSSKAGEVFFVSFIQNWDQTPSGSMPLAGTEARSERYEVKETDPGWKWSASHCLGL